MKKIEQLMQLLENDSSSVLLKRKLELISDLYDEVKIRESDTTVQIVREIVENFSEIISILEYNKKTASERSGDEDDESFFPSLDYLISHKGETDQQIIDAFTDYMDYSGLMSPRHTPASEATVKDYLKRLRRYAREHDNISLLRLYDEIEVHIARFPVNPQQEEQNKKAHGALLSALKKLCDMKSHVAAEQMHGQMLKYVEDFEQRDDRCDWTDFNLYENKHGFNHQFISMQQLNDVYNHANDVEQTFAQALMEFLSKCPESNPEIYQRMKIKKDLFSKALNGTHPQKDTAIRLAFALKLDIFDAEYLLSTAGYTLSESDKYDRAVRYLFESEIYELEDINKALNYCGLKGFENKRYGSTKRDRIEEETYKRTGKFVE